MPGPVAAPAQLAKGPAAPKAAPGSRFAIEGAQAKLEVGPANDRFEAEADRVADSIVSTAGPSSTPAISPLPSTPAAARKPVQREEARPMQQREEAQPVAERERETKSDVGDLAKMLQRKTAKVDGDLEELAQPKPDVGRLQRDNVDDDTILETTVQPKRETGFVQRDNVDDDTILETTVQPKREAVQRETVKANAEMEAEEPEAPAPVQRDGSGAAFTAPSGVESGIASMRGRGAALPDTTRSHMEPRFGRDLSQVRVHSGARAAGLARDVNARAFTIGQDIFFGAGQYQPSTGPGQRLLAHELTHTVQQQGQGSAAQAMRLQRDDTGEGEGERQPGEPIEVDNVGRLEKTSEGRFVVLEKLPLPLFGENYKGVGGQARDASFNLPQSIGDPWLYPGKTPRGGSARQTWISGMSAHAGTLQDRINEKANVANSPVRRGTQPIAYLRPMPTAPRAVRNLLIIGTPSELSHTEEVLLPIWDEDGSGNLFDADHIHELQLGGMDAIENFWLLDQTRNRSAGTNINSQIRTKIASLVQAGTTAESFTEDDMGSAPNWSTIKSTRIGSDPPPPSDAWRLKFEAYEPLDIASRINASWTFEDISTGRHIRQLHALSPAEIMEMGLLHAGQGNRTLAHFFALRRGGGFYRTVDFSQPPNVTLADELSDSVERGGFSGQQLFKGFAIDGPGIEMAPKVGTSAAQTPDEARLNDQNLQEDDIIATVSGSPFRANDSVISEPLRGLPIRWRRQFGFGGYIDQGWINENLARLSIEGLSPVAIENSGITPTGELYARGTLTATKALFPGLEMPIYLQGNDIFLHFPIPTDSLRFGAVEVRDAAVDVGFSEGGPLLAGNVNVFVQNVGSGMLTARYTESEGAIVEGDFTFDLDFLQEPTAGFKYRLRDDFLELNLSTGIREDALPGVRGGRITGTFSREAVSLSGTLNLAPPLEGGSLTLAYDRETGITISADDIPLPLDRLPGITGSSVSARVNYNPDEEAWALSGSGHADFSVPPASGRFSVGIDGPIVTIGGEASFRQGIVSGSLNATVTNQQLDEEGQPVEGELGSGWTAWGRGSASMEFGILTGTAGIELTPSGEINILGTVALPPSHEVFERESYERQLLSVESPDIPIWGVSLLGVGFGIFAFFDARLGFDAYVGPGTLEDTQVTVQFNLARPEDAVVDGNAEFVVPAGAGFTLDIGGGLRARLAVAFAEGRIGIDARLGLEAEARARAGFHWTRQEGLSLATRASATAHPVFDVGINASVRAGVDLGILGDITETWGPWREQLGSFGPEMEVGVAMPVAWSEQDGLDCDLDNIEVTRPDVDFGALVTDGFAELV